MDGLDLSPYSAGQTTCWYNLYGLVNHTGTLSSGHYTADRKHPYTAECHEFNDTRVYLVNQCSGNSSEAYVLFFELTSSAHVQSGRMVHL